MALLQHFAAAIEVASLNLEGFCNFRPLDDHLIDRDDGKRNGGRFSITRGLRTSSRPSRDPCSRISRDRKRWRSRHRRSRSEVYAAALNEYLACRAQDEVTDAVNRACDEIGGNDDAFLATDGRRVLADTEW